MKISKNENDWSKTLDSELLCEYIKPYKDCSGLGIDFPIWFDWNTNKSKVMLILSLFL